MVAAGTVITFHIAGRTGGLAPVNAGDVRSVVVDQLTPFFDVASVEIVRPGIWSVLDPSQWYYWDYAATVVASPRSDYAEIGDVDAVIAHAFVAAAGDTPTVTAPDYGEGEPGGVSDNPTAPPVPGLSDLGSLVKWIALGALGIAVIYGLTFVPRRS